MSDSMDIDDFRSVTTTSLRPEAAASASRPMAHSMRRGSISMAMSWKNSLGTSFNLLRAGNTLGSMFSTSPVGNTVFDMLNQSLVSGSFKDLHKIEETYLQDFTCCGLILRDLHELVQHWEEHQVDAGMETDMTLEDEDGWDDDTRTQPDVDGEGEMMLGEMDMHSPAVPHGLPHAPDTVAFPALRSRERDSSSPKPASPPTLSVSSFPSIGRNPYEGMRATPLDDLAPPSGVNPFMVGTEPSPYRSGGIPTPPSTTFEEEDISGPLPTFDDVEEYDEVETDEDVSDLDASEAGGSEDPDIPSTEEDSEPELADLPGRLPTEPKTHRGKRYPCAFPECDKVYKNPGGLKYHLAHTHPDPESAQIPAGLLGRNGKRGKNVPDIYKPYRCMVTVCGKRYKNLNGLKYHLEHHHTDIQDDPAKMNLPRTFDKDGKPKWDLSQCFDPLVPKNTKKPATVTVSKPEPPKPAPMPPSSSRTTKSRGGGVVPVPVTSSAPSFAIPVSAPAPPPMGMFIPSQPAQGQIPMNQAQLQVLATAIQTAAQNGQATPEQAAQMMTNLMSLTSLNK